jgi:hypothetical protein
MPGLSVYSITVPQTEVLVDPAARTGQFTVDIKNEQGILDRVVANIEAVATGGVAADPSWFAVDRHQRPIPAGGSEQFLVSATVPAATVAPGSYLMQPVAYSADHPPDDTRVSGPIMTLVVPPPPPLPPKPWWRKWWPWWLIGAIVAILLVVAVVVVVVVLSGGGNNKTVQIPQTAGLPAATATANLQALGLTVTQTSIRSFRPPGEATGTNPQAGTMVAPHSSVTLFVSRGILLPPLTLLPPVTAAGAGTANDAGGLTLAAS